MSDVNWFWAPDNIPVFEWTRKDITILNSLGVVQVLVSPPSGTRQPYLYAYNYKHPLRGVPGSLQECLEFLGTFPVTTIRQEIEDLIVRSDDVGSIKAGSYSVNARVSLSPMQFSLYNASL